MILVQPGDKTHDTTQGFDIWANSMANINLLPSSLSPCAASSFPSTWGRETMWITWIQWNLSVSGAVPSTEGEVQAGEAGETSPSVVVEQEEQLWSSKCHFPCKYP